MDILLSTEPALLVHVALLIPLVFGIAALLTSSKHPFQRAGMATYACLSLAVLVGVSWLLLGQGQLWVDKLWPKVRIDGVTVVMLGMVCFIAVIIVRFSRNYLAGDPGRVRYVRWLLAALAAVTLLILSNNLLLLASAWLATSLALHHLLIFYDDRPAALVAAHKKFLISRVADVALFSAIGLIGFQVGSFELQNVQAWVAEVPRLPAQMEAAAILLVLGAALKCAQLPFHGWLIQVMEAPTPVSALLHAGIVNIGGFLLIRMSTLIDKSSLAPTLLVIIGSSTAIVSALVMTTRVSVKVMLAWSTCAQMGFMLVQCGLGAYSLALMHIVAHSLYKAYAFLSSGSAVDIWRTSHLSPPRKRANLSRWFSAASLSLLGVWGVANIFEISPRSEPAILVLSLILSLSMTPLLVGRQVFKAALTSACLASLYFIWHAMFGRLLPPSASAQSSLNIWVVAVSFSGLFIVQAILQSRPHGHLARFLHPYLFAGLYLDEIFTRLTFRIWPPNLPVSANTSYCPIPANKAQEAC